MIDQGLLDEPVFSFRVGSSEEDGGEAIFGGVSRSFASFPSFSRTRADLLHLASSALNRLTRPPTRASSTTFPSEGRDTGRLSSSRSPSEMRSWSSREPELPSILELRSYVSFSHIEIIPRIQADSFLPFRFSRSPFVAPSFSEPASFCAKRELSN